VLNFWRHLASQADTGTALPPGQSQQSRHYPPPGAAPHNGRASGSRSRPLPAPPAVQSSSGASINSSHPQYHQPYIEPIPPRAPPKAQHTHHAQGSVSSLASTQRPGSNQPPQYRGGDIVDSQHGHSNGSQRSRYDYAGPQQNYGDVYQSGHRPPRISAPKLTVENIEPTPAHYRQSQAGGLSSHTASTRRDHDPRRMPVAPTITSPSNMPHSTPYYPPDGTSPSSQNGGYHYAADPRIMQHRQQPSYTAGRSSPTASNPATRSPIVLSPPEDDEDEGIGGVGAALMRSSSTASSFASAGSLLQEPRRPSVPHVEYIPSSRESPTPTNSSRNLPGVSLHPPSGEDFSRSNANSAGSYAYPSALSNITTSSGLSGPGSSRKKGGEYRRMASMKGPLELHDDGDESDDPDDIDELRFVNLSLLSHVANLLKNKVPRGTHVKGGIPYSKAFTGKDVVSTIQMYIQKEYQNNAGIPLADRKLALQVARSLQSQLFFYEVEWGGRKLTDGVEDVYMFLDEGDDNDGGGNSDAGGIPGERRSDVGRMDREELPTGVITLLTGCYSPSCSEGLSCYSYSCPRRASVGALIGL